MKTKSALESAFFNPRALVGFGFGAIGLLLGLVAFFALPKHSALAVPNPCTDVVYGYTDGEIFDAFYITMESHNEGYPSSQCVIYYTVSYTGIPTTPNHNSAIYTNPVPVLYGQTARFKAFGHQTSATPEDTGIFSTYINNN